MKNIWKSIKKSWINFLKRLEKSNQEQFGNKRPNCCDLNETKKHN